jgi:hypothetical protein
LSAPTRLPARRAAPRQANAGFAHRPRRPGPLDIAVRLPMLSAFAEGKDGA